MRKHFAWTFIGLMKLSQAKLNMILATALCFLVAVSAVAIEKATLDESEPKTDSIWSAAKTGDIKAIKQHLADGVGVNARDGELGVTPLTWAALLGQTEAIELLIQKGADVNARNKDGGIPLHGAAFLGETEIVILLIQKGADVNAKNNNGETPLDAVAAEWSEEIKGITEFIAAILQIKVDTEKVRAARPKIAALLRRHSTKHAPQTGSETGMEASGDRPEEIIEQMIRESITALNSKDFKGMAKDIHPIRYSVFGSSPQGELVYLPKEALVGLMEGLFSLVGNISSSDPMDLKVWVHGDAAFATYIFKTRIGEKSVTIRITGIYYRIDGVWQAVHSHQSHFM